MKAGNEMEQEKRLYCNFCGRDHKQLRMLVAGESANICDDCALEAMAIFAREAERKKRESSTKDRIE